jgi:hypothetical protein
MKQQIAASAGGIEIRRRCQHLVLFAVFQQPLPRLVNFVGAGPLVKTGQIAPRHIAV